MSALLAVGGMLAAPRRALAGASERGIGVVLLPLLGFLLVELVVTAKVLYWAVILAADQPGEAIERVYEALWKNARNDLVLLVSVVIIVFVAGRVMKKQSDPLGVAALLLVPLCALKLVGVSLLALGVDQWWLPHHPVDSPVIVVERQVSYLRFVLKHVSAYGISAVLLVLYLVDLKRGTEARDFPKRGLAGGAALVLLFVVAAAGAYADAAKNDKWLRPAVPGDLVSNETLPWLSAGTTKPKGRFALEGHRGQVVVLDFWASWCAPCRRAMPELSALQDELGPAGVQIVGINRDQGGPGKTKAERFLFEQQPSFPSAWDNRHWGDTLGLRSLPTSFVLDQKGVLRHLHLGYTAPEVYRAEIQALLNEAKE